MTKPKPRWTCDVPDCDRSRRARGLCSLHYQRVKAGHDPLVDPRPGRRAPGPQACAVDGCSDDVDTRAMCGRHHKRIRVRPPCQPRPSVTERFMAKVDQDREDGCWLWTAGIADTGYGTFLTTGRGYALAHRYSYELHVGPIPAGLELDHLCRVRACVNPAHLEPVTHAENCRRARRIGHDHPNAPTACKRGHDWSETPPIVVHRSDGTTSRTCRVCEYDRQRIRRAARRPA